MKTSEVRTSKHAKPVAGGGAQSGGDRARLLVLVLGEALVIDVLDLVTLDARVAVGLLVDVVLEQLYAHATLSVQFLFTMIRVLQSMLT